MSRLGIQEIRPKIERLTHTNFDSGRPFYDDELKMAQSKEHMITVTYLYYCIRFIAKSLGLECFSDHPVWYLLSKPIKGKTQKALYPDICVSKELDATRVTAEDLIFCLEVVSTERRRKEIKDRIIMKGRNEYNQVSEFVVVYPKASDNRVIEYYHYDGFGYIPLFGKNGEFHSKVVKGLSIREIPRDDWKDGEKVEVLYQGKVLVNYDELWERLEEVQVRIEQEKERAEREKERAEREKERAEREKSEKEKLVQKLRELGYNPDKL